MLSVFITPCTKPTSIHRATRSACAAATASSSATAGTSAAAAAGWWRAIAWSVRRRRRSRVAERGGDVLEGPDPQVAGGDAGEDGAGQESLAANRLAGGHDGQRARRRDAERVHRLADKVLAEHRSDGRRPSPPRANGVRPEPLRWTSRRRPWTSRTSPSSSARPSPSRGDQPPN